MSSLPALPPDARPRAVPVGPWRSSAPVVGLAVALGLVLGLGLGSRFGQPSADPTQGSTADVRPDSVSQRLRMAVASAGGSAVVCITDATVVCSPTTATSSERGFSDFTYSFSEAEWSATSSTATRSGHLVVAAVLGGVAAPSTLIPLGTDAQPVGRTDIAGVRPADEGGRYYFDLGIVAPGRYLLVVGAVVTDPSGALQPATYLVALIVGG